MATLDPWLVSESQPGNATTDELDFEQALSFALCKLENKDFTLKAQQKEAVKHVWEGKDVFVLLPTGFGKSIIYEVLPFLFDYKLGRMHGQTKSLVIVVSPLVSLMADQVSSLKSSSQGSGGRYYVLNVCHSKGFSRHRDFHTCSFLFGSPEALISSKWREQIDTPMVADRIIAVVIDEAHCVSKW